ncbi:MAG: lipoyl(octanoyl) transferase LipB [Bacteroidia bacterium]
MKEIYAAYLGLIPYQEAWELQKKLVAEKLENLKRGISTPDWLLLCQHKPVITLGKNAKANHILLSPETLKRREISVYAIERGGDVTYHGPGQLVGYPILHLEKYRADVGWYMRALEEVIIRLLADWGLEATRFPPHTGVWLMDPPRKIAAQGVKLSRWVSMHGFALNVTTDLTPFQWIIPCGLSMPVTSMHMELNYAPEMSAILTRYLKHFSDVFEVSIVEKPVWILYSPHP